MNKTKTHSTTLYSITYYIFNLLLLSVPLAFWKSFDSSFDLVKSAVLNTIGGLFIFLCSIYIIANLRKREKLKGIWLDKTIDPLVLFFLLSAAASAIFSVNSYVSFFGNYERQIGLVTYLNLFIVYMFSPIVLNDEKKITSTLLLMEVMAFIAASVCIVHYFGLNLFNLQPPGAKRPFSIVGHPIFSAGFMTMLFPLSVLNIAGKKSLFFRIFSPIVIFAGIVATQTRTTYIALAVEIVIIAISLPVIYKTDIMKAKKIFLYTVCVLFVIGVSISAVVHFFPHNPAVKRFLSIADITNLPRWLLWRDSVKLFKHYPVTGTGIGTFSIVFENYASNELRFAEISNTFDHPHSNFLNAFCTMGLLGGIAYLLILFQTARVSFKAIFDIKNKPGSKLFFLFVLCSFFGYVTYGIADFDEVTITLYFFILLSLFKVKYYSYSGDNNLFQKFSFGKTLKVFFAVIIMIFSFYLIFLSYRTITAQSYFTKGVNRFSSGDFPGFVNYMKSALEMSPGESVYRYIYAYNLMVYASGKDNISVETRNSFLEQAKVEAIKSRDNSPSPMESLALLSLIELELGHVQEGMKLKDEVFKTDSRMLSYRNNLAKYYLKHNNDSAALNETMIVLSWYPKDIEALITSALVYLKLKQKEDVIYYCRKILEIDSNNEIAKSILANLPGLIK